jgi:hypothetical protein
MSRLTRAMRETIDATTRDATVATRVRLGVGGAIGAAGFVALAVESFALVAR